MATPTYTPIASQTLTSSAASVTFSSIPTDGTYRDLVLVIQNSSSSGSYLFYRFNGVTTSSYPAVYMTGDGTNATSSTNNFTYFDLSFGIGTPDGATVISHIMDFAATDKHKTVLSRTSKASSGVAAGAGRFASTSAITSIEITQTGFGNFAAGSTFSLYGVAA